MIEAQPEDAEIVRGLVQVCGVEPAEAVRLIEQDRELAALGDEAALWRLGTCRRLGPQIQATADELKALTAYCAVMGVPLDES